MELHPGRRARPKNHEAAAAAQIFWNGSVGILSIGPVKKAIESIVDRESKSWGSERLNGWRRHFELAKAPALSKDRAEFRRHLKESKQAEMLAGNK
jgi:hypothetical protein